jgi:hypothetical protein
VLKPLGLRPLLPPKEPAPLTADLFVAAMFLLIAVCKFEMLELSFKRAVVLLANA